MSKVGLLRVVTNRLNSTPVKELPHIAYFLASSIQDCADTLKSASGQAAVRTDDVALQVHKLKARLASLLQDKTAECRFTAVVLVKATIEAGGRAILESCEPWVRGLLAILGRPDPVSSKRLCLLTITRIFHLTRQYPTITREITTPLLPAFVTACVKLGALHQSRTDGDASPRPSPYLETVLQCMLQLIPHHPSTFRPFASKLHASLVKFIGSQDNTDHISHLAQSVFVALFVCAPKNTGSDEWVKACQMVVSSIHEIADQILRAVTEDWEPSDGSPRQTYLRKAFDDVPQGTDGGIFDLPPWQGIYPGSRMLISLLHLLETLLRGNTSQSVIVPVGIILDLTSRFLYVRVPAHSKETQTTIRFNAEISRDEREELLAILPKIHQSTLNLLSCVVEVLGLSILPTSHSILDQCIWVFGTEASTDSVRLTSYNLLNNLIPLIGPSLTRDSFKQLIGFVDHCCKDLAATSIGNDKMPWAKVGSNVQVTAHGHADSFLQSASKKTTDPPPQGSAIQTASSRLLCRILEYIPAQSIPHSVRAQLDRAAILTDDKRAMLASVLNPPPVTTDKSAAPSILPFLTRTSNDQLEVEALLRPRMPVIRDGTNAAYGLDDSIEETMDEHYEIQNPTNGTERGNLAQPAPDPSPAQNDLLDRLEDSIEDRTAPASNPEIPQHTTANQQRNSEPVISEQNDGNAVHRNSALQGLKRDLEPSDLHEEEEEEEQSSKRVRNDEPLHPQLETIPTAPPGDTIAYASAAAATSAIVLDDVPDADAAVPLPTPVTVDVRRGAGVVDKGKGRARSVSPPRGEGIGTGGLGRENMDGDDVDDDESDFEMPPLYLKTTSEEEEEEQEDEDEDEDQEIT
jgi:pre-rRNA-processing protein RIX1